MDNYVAGMNTVIYGEPQKTVTAAAASGALQSVNVPKEYAEPLSEGINAGLGIFGPMKAGRILAGTETARHAALAEESGVNAARNVEATEAKVVEKEIITGSSKGIPFQPSQPVRISPAIALAP